MTTAVGKVPEDMEAGIDEHWMLTILSILPTGNSQFKKYLYINVKIVKKKKIIKNLFVNFLN